jgi:class 3 adenylate cyclase
MAWNASRSKSRIAQHLKTVPDFDETITLAKRAVQKRFLADGTLDKLTNRKAFVVEGAHLYGHLLDYDQMVVDAQGKESERSHEILLRFLDAQYQLWDAIVEDGGAERVDYHGTRLHAIVSEPAGDPSSQVEKALSLANTLNIATARIAATLGVPGRLRFGIDQGKCLALTTGRHFDKDILFMGQPANYAAKLATGGQAAGVYVSPRANIALEATSLSTPTRNNIEISKARIEKAGQKYRFQKLEEAVTRIANSEVVMKKFSFFSPELPLSELKFADLSPSKTARLGLASLFADIDGFTAFVDNAISSGSDAINAAATGIHVIREELNDVLKLDFGGKRVRFIGDCIHGTIALDNFREGATQTIKEAALCASGMESSFELCKEAVPSIEDLGLAIGIEFGDVAITRLGSRGQESVRCAAGKAVVVSERIQEEIEDSGVKLGPIAFEHADEATKENYANSDVILGYSEAVDLLGDIRSPAFSIMSNDQSARPHSK